MRKVLLVLALWPLTPPSAGAESLSPISACAPCHGLDGIGHDAEIPNLAGQNELYLLNQLRAFRDKRRRHKEMLYIGRKLSDADMKSLAAYFASLPPR